MTAPASIPVKMLTDAAARLNCDVVAVDEATGRCRLRCRACGWQTPAPADVVVAKWLAGPHGCLPRLTRNCIGIEGEA